MLSVHERRQRRGQAAAPEITQEKKTKAAATKKPTTRPATSRKAAAPEITQEKIAERAYHISQSGEAGPTRRTGNGPRRSCGRARSAVAPGSARGPAATN